MKNLNLEALNIQVGTNQRPTKNAPRILIIDIETSPHLAFTFDLWNANIGPDKIVEPSRVMCFAAQWFGSNTVQFYSEYHDGREEMIRRAWELLDEADIVVGYNHVRFDIPHLQREFLLAGYGPTRPFRNVDLLRVNRSNFRLASNRLGAVGDTLGIGTKVETGGWSLWKAVLENDAKAWKKFRAYNIQDVRLTGKLLTALGPWVKDFPHVGLWTGNSSACYRCGSANLTHIGATQTNVSTFPLMLCECGAHNRVLRNGQTRKA